MALVGSRHLPPPRGSPCPDLSLKRAPKKMRAERCAAGLSPGAFYVDGTGCEEGLLGMIDVNYDKSGVTIKGIGKPKGSGQLKKVGKPKESAEFCQLRIALRWTKPEVWRRLIVPMNANLGWVHAVIQTAMGWTNSHLHMFRSGGTVISDPRFELDSFEGDPPVMDEGKTKLSELLADQSEEIIYEYDLGDSWIHLITVEEVSDPASAVVGRAVCVGGARACPPEDCGGPPGYENLLKALKNRKHPDHKSLKDWLGRPFDAEAFSVDDRNVWLGKLAWPRVTEGALRKVLIARDNAALP
jgi:hypothetical protein